MATWGYEELVGSQVDAPYGRQIPAFIARTEPFLDIFWAPGSARHDVLHLYAGTGDDGWVGWEHLGGGPLQLPLAAGSRAPGHVAVFGVAADGTLRHAFWADHGWGGWYFENLGGQLASAPAVLSMAPETLDVLAPDFGGTMRRLSWSGGRWNGWQPAGGPDDLDGTPAVASSAPGVLDICAVRASGELVHWQLGGPTSRWTTIGQTVLYEPVCLSRRQNLVEMFFTQADHSVLWASTAQASEPDAWNSLRGSIVADPGSCFATPAVVGWGSSDEIHCFLGTGHGTLRHLVGDMAKSPLDPAMWVEAGWGDTQSQEVASGLAVRALSWGPDRIDVLSVDAGGLLVHRSADLRFG